MIASTEEAKDVDYENTGSHLSDNNVFIGTQARIYTAEHEDDLSGSSSIQEFFDRVRSYYCETTRQIKK